MADIFSKSEARSLLSGKYVLIIGDSNSRALYNDLIYLLHTGKMVTASVLRKHTKYVHNCPDIDRVISKSKEKSATRHIEEVREYKCDSDRVRFCFITRILGSQMEKQLEEIEQFDDKPDIVVLSSCIWDVSRWGPRQESSYKTNCMKVFTRLKLALDYDSLVIWLTALPVSELDLRGGLSVKQLDFMSKNLNFMIAEANFFVTELCKLFYIDVLDMHYHMRLQLARRCGDGIHWEPHPMRQMTCVLLTHIALSYDHHLPNCVPSRYLDEAVERRLLEPENSDCVLQSAVRDEVRQLLTDMTKGTQFQSSKRSKPKKCQRRIDGGNKTANFQSVGTKNANYEPLGKKSVALLDDPARNNSALARLGDGGRGNKTENSVVFNVNGDPARTSSAVSRLGNIDRSNNMMSGNCNYAGPSQCVDQRINTPLLNIPMQRQFIQQNQNNVRLLMQQQECYRPPNAMQIDHENRFLLQQQRSMRQYSLPVFNTGTTNNMFTNNHFPNMFNFGRNNVNQSGIFHFRGNPNFQPNAPRGRHRR